MANEFIIRNGLVVQSGTTIITGSLNVSGSISSTVPTSNPYISQGILTIPQLIPDNTDTPIQFVDDFDTNNWWNSGTYTLTPTIAGYYLISLGVWFEHPGVATGQCNAQARKNGSTFMIIQQPLNNVSSGISLTGTIMTYMNGTTDYLDFSAYHIAGAPRGILPNGTWFSATLLAI